MYAINKIKPEYKKVYVQRAKADLETTGTKERTYWLAKRYIGNVSAEYYKAIMDEDLSRLEKRD